MPLNHLPFSIWHILYGLLNNNEYTSDSVNNKNVIDKILKILIVNQELSIKNKQFV
jgi:hypothetical protein